MELHQLQILRELGALGSVSAVADALEVSPSAVSQHLAALQRGFQTPLTRKQGRTLVLTEAGAVLAAAGATVIDAMTAARSAVEEFEQSRVGTVTVSGFHSAGQALFGGLLRDLAARPPAPEVRFSDVDAAGERWVASRHGYSPDDVLGAVAALANQDLTVLHRINDYGAVVAVVASGDVIGLVPRYTSPAAHDQRIALRPLTEVNAMRSIDVLARPEKLRRRSVRMVVGALRRVVSDLTNTDEPPVPRR